MAGFYQFYPNVVTLIGSRHGDKTNLMPAVWQTGVSKNPMVYVVSISQKRFTHGLIKASGVFSANFVDFKYVKTIARLGSCSGRDIDKIKEFGVELGQHKQLDVPIVKFAYASFECSVQEIIPSGDHDLFVGRIASVHEAGGIKDGSETIDCNAVRPLLYLGKDTYITVDTGSIVTIRR
ncbi:MAG: flavin reductase family protein [Deltaproteobacteria bacterium]|nr:flavin reductase family protein [Deltaproteobacteria bacterium]MCL5278053.1 flavin reductase family protein [Deltaproteobacteria bacterium]